VVITGPDRISLYLNIAFVTDNGCQTYSTDAVIRVYDDAGNVIKGARTQGRVQRVVALDSFTDCSQPFVVDADLVRVVRSLSVGQL